MELSQILFISIISAIISFSITYFIIAVAVKEGTRELRQHARIQTDLFTKMAKRSGVTEDEIQEAYSR